ncbi:hypothetical protein PBI_UNTOUCHABLE_3 [Gordonia phage Untouchable]|uniref:Uncharacterized protein n=1 Tax=Gordonia phage Untouchable TaxID=2656542 RepID=A0A649V9L7_9CAUD|nr:hypothetical protein HWC79_gp03 [Gordonia phage Untouchable]QGJ89048.1 hypothetical protein PBI_UNTOUCHABLE_3 [Gordonia phage Untouchable]
MGILVPIPLIAPTSRATGLVVTMLAKMYRSIIDKTSNMIATIPTAQNKSLQTKETSLVVGTSSFP